jgi:hypothetical protein
MTVAIPVLVLVAILTIALLLAVLNLSYWVVHREDRMSFWLAAWFIASSVFALCRILQYSILSEEWYLLAPRISLSASFSLVWVGYELVNSFLGYRPPRWERAVFFLPVYAAGQGVWGSNHVTK